MTPDATTSLEEIEAHYASAIEHAADEAALEEVRVDALGKKGVVSLKMRELGSMDPETRKAAGATLNALRDRLQGAIETRKAVLAEGALAARLEAERLDVTLDPPRELPGSVHPVSQVMDECLAIFAEMGFSIAEGPDIEDDFYNFTALNFPPDHPAREMHDTFFFAPGADGTRKLLRTHTSPVQIRHMQAHQPPVRIMSPGRTYRCDSDQTHTPMFHQIEGLVIDEEAHMGHLKWVLETFVKAFFETEDVTMRFRPHFFPFTEPSAEMDIARGGGRWLEILGCGMVHPNVLRNVGYDPEIYQGFAFGMGIDRLAMLKYGITDLRPFFEADVRWLAHYGFRPLDLPMLLAGLSR